MYARYPVKVFTARIGEGEFDTKGLDEVIIEERFPVEFRKALINTMIEQFTKITSHIEFEYSSHHQQCKLRTLETEMGMEPVCDCTGPSIVVRLRDLKILPRDPDPEIHLYFYWGMKQDYGNSLFCSGVDTYCLNPRFLNGRPPFDWMEKNLTCMRPAVYWGGTVLLFDSFAGMYEDLEKMRSYMLGRNAPQRFYTIGPADERNKSSELNTVPIPSIPKPNGPVLLKYGLYTDDIDKTELAEFFSKIIAHQDKKFPEHFCNWVHAVVGKQFIHFVKRITIEYNQPLPFCTFNSTLSPSTRTNGRCLNLKCDCRTSYIRITLEKFIGGYENDHSIMMVFHDSIRNRDHMNYVGVRILSSRYGDSPTSLWASKSLSSKITKLIHGYRFMHSSFNEIMKDIRKIIRHMCPYIECEPIKLDCIIEKPEKKICNVNGVEMLESRV